MRAHGASAPDRAQACCWSGASGSEGTCQGPCSTRQCQIAHMAEAKPATSGCAVRSIGVGNNDATAAVAATDKPGSMPHQWGSATHRSRCAAHVQRGRPHCHVYPLMPALCSLAGVRVEDKCHIGSRPRWMPHVQALCWCAASPCEPIFYRAPLKPDTGLYQDYLQGTASHTVRS